MERDQALAVLAAATVTPPRPWFWRPRIEDAVTAGEGAIGFASLRGGSVAGDHAVHFLSDNERLTLSHLAENRAIFAKGAVRAAQWLIGRPKGRYGMGEVLGL
jgi:4-hydroxy-tetrahydrodipicolinate reductase